MTSVTGDITRGFEPRVSVARVAGSTHKSARNTSNAKAVQHKKGSGEKLARPVVRIQTVEAKTCMENLKGLAKRL